MTENKGDLISREALKETIIKICGKCSNNITEYDENHIPNGNCAIFHILNMIDNAPTVEISQEQAIDKLNEIGWLYNHDKAIAEFERPQGDITEEDIQNAIRAGYENGYSMAQAKYQRPQGNWIPVSERLPEERKDITTNDFEEVLCSTTFGKVRAYKYGKPIGHTEAHFWYGWGIMDNEIIAWQPLPEPYKADMRGDKE